MISTGLLLLASLFPTAQAQVVPVASVAAKFLLTTSTSFSFPTATLSLSQAQSFIVNNWGLSKGKFQNGENDTAFASDPFPNNDVPVNPSNTTGPVLQITYPEGSYNNQMPGGSQFYAPFNTSGSPFESMMLSYEIAFDTNFDFVKGGKLPGLRGGPDPVGCSGGSQVNGSDCYSVRLMWRTNGAGEGGCYVFLSRRHHALHNVL